MNRRQVKEFAIKCANYLKYTYRNVHLIVYETFPDVFPIWGEQIFANVEGVKAA